MIKKFIQWFWFIGGFAVGFSLVAFSHASVPALKKSIPISEMKVNKVTAPELEQEYSNLTSMESKYAESAEQQKKLKSATLKNARRYRQ